MSGSVAERRGSGVTARGLALGLGLSLFLLPLAWTMLAAFGIVPNNELRPPAFAGRPTLENFVETGVAEPTFWLEVWTSSASAVCAAGIATVTGLLAAYALARGARRRGRTIAQCFLVLAVLPPMAYALPLGSVLDWLRLRDSFVGLVTSEAAVTAPLAVYVLHGAIRQVPEEYEEAAWIEGAGVARLIGRVVLPIVAPSVAATGIVLFVLNWNMLLVPLIAAGIHVKTIPVAMADFFTFERELEWPVAAAALLVSLVPVALLVAFSRRLLDRFSL
ncbi:MAG TPA: ABC transporter permease subunit [Candidatus Limnocylindrales bacterium]